MTKEVRVSVRVTAELKARLHKAEEVTGLPETQVVVRSLEAYCDYVEKHGDFTVPFVMLPKRHMIKAPSLTPPLFGESHEEWLKRMKESADGELAADEDQSEYGITPAEHNQHFTASVLEALEEVEEEEPAASAPSPARSAEPAPPPAEPALKSGKRKR